MIMQDLVLCMALCNKIHCLFYFLPLFTEPDSKENKVAYMQDCKAI